MDEEIPLHPADVALTRCHTYRPLGFTSEKEWRIYTHYTNRYVIGIGHGTSEVSQEEADERALASAQLDAENRFRSLVTPIGDPRLWPVDSL